MMMIVDKVCKERSKVYKAGTTHEIHRGPRGLIFNLSRSRVSYLLTILINLNIMGSYIKKIWCPTFISTA